MDLIRRGSTILYDGHWPAQTPSARIGGFAGKIAQPLYRVIRPRLASRPADAIHVAGLCESVPIFPLPNPPPTVTIIILNRQGARMLGDLLSSFHRVNRYPNIDLIVVDHGSTDDSVSVAEKWAKTLPLTVVRCSRNHSFSFSCNRAAERATGEYLLLLNNDIVLSQDIVGPMVATAARYRGMVGCKLLDGNPPKRKDESRSVQHIGVRFTGNLRRRVFGPYDVRPTASDERLASSPSHFLAVTAAISACRRDDYLRIGGLCEEYVYGFEDVDLNLKLALGWGRKNICLNSVSALHHGRATRKTSSRDARKVSLENNFKVFSRRFGYAVRRTMLPAWFTDDGSLWGARASLAFVPDPTRESACLETLGQRGRSIRRLRGHDMRDLALLIVANPNFRLERGRNRHPLMQRIAWVMSDAGQWRDHDFAIYDLVVAADVALADTLMRRHGILTAVLEPEAPDVADRLAALIAEYLRVRHRISIKCHAGDDDDRARPLASALRLAGHCVRIDRPADWGCLDSIRDDIAILMPGVRVCPTAYDKIVVACGDAAPGGTVDIRLPMTEPKELAAAILDAIAPAHAKRMLGPTDQPLSACDVLDRQIIAAWD
jgi:GT2 family glycosyltransferase